MYNSDIAIENSISYCDDMTISEDVTKDTKDNDKNDVIYREDGKTIWYIIEPNGIRKEKVGI